MGYLRHMTSEPQMQTQAPALSTGRRIGPMALAGLAGGVLGAILAEVIQIKDETENRFFDDNLSLSSGMWFMLGLLGVGAALILSQGLIEKNLEKSGTQLVVALPAVLIGGFMSGVIGQSVYTSLFEQQRLARTIGWMIAGGLAGVAVGLAFRSSRRVLNGGLGGLGGGLLAGLLFDPISESIASESAATSRLVGFMLIGLLMGALIALIDVATSDFFLELANTELVGRQFILFDQTSLVGCARNVAVTLTKDPLIREQHVKVTKTAGGLAYECVAGAPPVLVNGQQSTQGILTAGSFMQVGNTLLRVGARRGGSVPQRAATGQQEQTFGAPADPRPLPPSATPGQAQAPSASRARPTIPMKPKK